MADKQESALTQQSDCKWVRALDANGNSIRISKEDLAAVVGGLLPEATSKSKGLMPSKYPYYYPLASWVAPSSENKLYKIGIMKKQSGAINPLGMFAWEKCVGRPTTFFTFSIVNRREAIYRGINDIGPGSRASKFYYKEEDQMLSLYIYVPAYTFVYVIFANTEGLENTTFLKEEQGSTDTSGLIEITK